MQKFGFLFLFLLSGCFDSEPEIPCVESHQAMVMLPQVINGQTLLLPQYHTVCDTYADCSKWREATPALASQCLPYVLWKEKHP